jgi:hypothetical protein
MVIMVVWWGPMFWFTMVRRVRSHTRQTKRRKELDAPKGPLCSLALETLVVSLIRSQEQEPRTSSLQLIRILILESPPPSEQENEWDAV